MLFYPHHLLAISDTPVVLNCPGPILRGTLPEGFTEAPVFWQQTPIALDSSGLQLMVYQTHLPGEVFPLGQTPVAYLFMDQAGNIATCTFTIILTDGTVSILPCMFCTGPYHSHCSSSINHLTHLSSM